MPHQFRQLHCSGSDRISPFASETAGTGAAECLSAQLVYDKWQRELKIEYKYT